MNSTVNIILPPSPWLISDSDLVFLGPLYLSAYLKEHGFNVTVTDLSGQDLTNWIPAKYDVYGITGTTPNFPQIKFIAERIRDLYSTSLIVAGGVHATMASEHLLRNSEVDICVEGPGEKKFSELIEFSQCDGLVYKNKTYDINGAITFSMFDLESENYKVAPIPDYEAIDFKKYLPSQTFKYLLGKVSEATILTTLGCPNRCSFCAQHKMRSKIKFIPLTDVEANIDHLRNNYEVELFYVLDDTFGFAKNRFNDLCNLFKRKGIKWHCLLRADLAQKSRLEIMRESGCLGIVFGFESGSNKILKLMNKGTKRIQNYEAARLTHKVGMVARGQMIVGFPGETDKTIEETKLFIKSLPHVIWGIHDFVPFPGSDIWEYPEKYGIEIDKNTDFSDYHTIGRPGQSTGNSKIQEWANELREIAGDREIGNIIK